MAALDPSIPFRALAGGGAQQSNVVGTLSDMLHVQRQAGALGEETRKRKAQARIEQLLAESPDDPEAALIAAAGEGYATEAYEVAEQIGKARFQHAHAYKAQLETDDQLLVSGAQRIQGIRAAPPDMQQSEYSKFREWLMGHDPKLDPGPVLDFGTLDALQAQGQTAAEFGKAQQHAIDMFFEGKYQAGLATALGAAPSQEARDAVFQGAKAFGAPAAVLGLFDPTWSPETQARDRAASVSEKDRLTIDALAGERQAQATSRAADDTRATDALGETKRHNRAMEARPVGGSAASAAASGVDPEAIAQAIIDGKQPPTLQGLYRHGAAVRTILAKKGYDYATASADWQAATKHFQTINGAQQTRIRQAVYTARESVDVIDELAKQWKGGRFPILNRANLALAKGGAYGKDAASIATKLEGQITDVVSELANVYMGGNSPTDHALKLAEKNLSADWDERVLRDMTALARKNLDIRSNSIEQAAAIGPSADNPYDGHTPAPPAAAGPAAGGPKVGERRTIGGRLGEWDGKGWKAVK